MVEKTESSLREIKTAAIARKTATDKVTKTSVTPEDKAVFLFRELVVFKSFVDLLSISSSRTEACRKRRTFRTPWMESRK